MNRCLTSPARIASSKASQPGRLRSTCHADRDGSVNRWLGLTVIFGTVSVPLAPQLPARAFCSVWIIDTQPEGSGLRVGTIVYCEEYARRGGSLLSGKGAQEAVVLTLSPATAPTSVTAVSYEPDDAPPSWFSATYTSAGSAEIQSILIGSTNSNLTDPSIQARAAFGLPASAPVELD